MRGTLDPAHPEIDQTGIIPAYAGNTPYCIPVSNTIWDHPRVCGEHSPLLESQRRYEGSSPRMRGTPGAHAERVLDTGIIPAYAGNTSTVWGDC